MMDRPAAAPWRVAALITLGVMLVYIIATLFLVPRLNYAPERVSPNAFTENLPRPSMTPHFVLVGVWQVFDTLWYRHVAESGYDQAPAVVFYPLFPLSIRALHVLGIPTDVAAILVPRLATFLLLWGLIELLSLDLPRGDVYRTLAALLLWPMSFFLFAGYAEALLMAATVWSIYFGRKASWWAAAACCCLASLSRAVGMVAIAPLLWLAWQRRELRPGPIALALAGPLLFPLWLQLNGLPLPSQAYPIHWHTALAFPWTTLMEVFRQMQGDWSRVIQLNLGAMILTFTLALRKQTRFEYSLYALGTLCFLLTANATPALHSVIRYCLPVFPAQVAAGRIAGAQPRVMFLMGCVVFLMNLFLLYAFFDWYFLI